MARDFTQITLSGDARQVAPVPTLTPVQPVRISFLTLLYLQDGPSDSENVSPPGDPSLKEGVVFRLHSAQVV